MQSFQRIASSFLSFFLLIFSTSPLCAQASDSNANVYVISLLILMGALILIAAVLMLSENFIQIEAKKSGMDDDQTELSLIPSIKNLWQSKGPVYTLGSKVTHLKQGHDILLNGGAPLLTVEGSAKRFALRPGEFRGNAPIPKMEVAEGDEVKAGDPLFHDKAQPSIKYVSPVSGEVVEVRRGAKRAITDVIVLADKKVKYKQFDPPSISEASRDDIVSFLCDAGAWPLLNERPFDIVPNPDTVPRDIFISTFDSAPIAPNLSYVVEGREDLFQKGIDTLARLTSGDVHLGLDARGEDPPSSAFVDAANCKKHWFAGKHPSGNVGIQIHHVNPIKSGESVWVVNVQDVIILGELMFKGVYNAQKLIAVGGAQITEPSYHRTYQGASISELIGDGISKDRSRIIDGDVLSGKATGSDDFLSIKSDQITAIEEGDYYEMFGWLLPLKPRPTISKTFPNFLYPNLKFDGDTNTHGERRAFVVTGQYEQVLPMDVYPQHLLKAILANDYERMEGLGINELSEEDLALCEFVCTSKIQVQKILRDGLDMMMEQV